MERIQLGDKEFKPLITTAKIEESINRIASEIEHDYPSDIPLFLPILNGAFVFAADLLRKINIHCTISFLKLSSYAGAKSSGEVKQLIGMNEAITGQPVIVLEDIIDTGITLENIKEQLQTYSPAEIKVASLLYKPESCKKQISIDYIGHEIPNVFVAGYGIDYSGLGRNLPAIYYTDV